MTQPRQPLTDALARGWRWWTRELKGLVPARAPGTAAKAPIGIVVSSDGSSLRLIDERQRPRGKSGPRAERTGTEAWDALVDVAKSSRPPPVRLRLPYTACFVRRVELPEAAREEAHRFLELDLERTTPFRLKDVYTAHYVEEALSRGGTLSLCQLIVRRESVDRSMADIQSAGVKLAAVDCWSEDGTTALPVDFLTRAPEGGKGVPGSVAAKLLAAAALALTLSAAYLAVSRHESALAELTARTDEARTKVQGIRQTIETSEAALGEIAAVRKLRASRRPAVEVVDGLTRLLPDTAWVSDLRIEGDAIEISGEADAAAPLVSLIENSELFSEAAFTAPVTREARGGKERFSLRARIGEATGAAQDAAGDGGETRP